MHIRYGQKRHITVTDKLTVYIGGGGRGCRGHSDGDNYGSNADNERRMGGYSYRYIVVAISTSSFGPAVMSERILRHMQRLRQSKGERESGERTTGYQCRYKWYREEQ